jgi:hypothetical protein
MKTLFYSCFLFSIILFCLSCKKNVQEDNAIYQIKLTKGEENGKKIVDFIDNIDYIKLETTEESLLGFISKLTITNDRIYVLDQLLTKALFVFDKSGKFLFKIGRVGNGPGEYVVVTDFYLNEKDSTIHLLADGRKIINFDYDGSFIDEKRLPLLHSSYILPFSCDNYALVNHVSAGDEYLVYMTNQNFDIQKQYLKTPKGWERIVRLLNIDYSEANEKYLLSYICSTTIYELSGNDIIPKYNFIIPENEKLTESKIDNLKQLDTHQLVMETFNYFSLEGYFELDNILFVEFSMNKNKYWGMFDMLNNTFEYNERSYDKVEDNFAYPIFLSRVNEKSLAGFIMPSLLPEDNYLGLTEDSNPIIGIYDFDFSHLNK